MYKPQFRVIWLNYRRGLACVDDFYALFQAELILTSVIQANALLTNRNSTKNKNGCTKSKNTKTIHVDLEF